MLFSLTATTQRDIGNRSSKNIILLEIVFVDSEIEGAFKGGSVCEYSHFCCEVILFRSVLFGLMLISAAFRFVDQSLLIPEI